LKVTYYVAMSLDGFIARKDGDVAWLDSLEISMAETGYDTFFDSVDALVMGRSTYDFIHNYGTWPYGKKPTWICTRNSISIIEGCNLQAGSTPQDVKKAATELGIGHLWLVGGGRLASWFIENKMLTHISISQMPIILGEGVGVFSELEEPINVKRKNVQPQKSGFTQLDFEIEYT